MSRETAKRIKERPAHRKPKNKGQSDMTREELSLTFINGSFRPDNIGWISNLRPGLYSDIVPGSGTSLGLKNGEEDAEDKNDERRKAERDAYARDSAMPPSFYGRDMEKWKKKFDTATKHRETHKKLYSQRYGCE